MTVQFRDGLTINGERTSLWFSPLDKEHPRIVLRTKEEMDKILADIEAEGYLPMFTGTCCWNGYLASWVVKDGQLYLNDIIGKYRLADGPPLFAEWFTGEIKVSRNGEVDHLITFNQGNMMSFTPIERPSPEVKRTIWQRLTSWFRR